MRTVTADAIKSRNKQKSTSKQIHQENSRKTKRKKNAVQWRMQTHTADASYSKQRRQHWKNSNQIIKKYKSLITNKFFRKISVTHAGEEKRVADTIEQKQGKIHNTGKYGK